ncbi:TATA box-binding protein-associated factor RNA polymerase I subunit B-like, partial [Eucyclogobius newberryi]|uniref:TATA box-binding protein-associated factor RNA polymerase I subunit B-like n=1 Tax=Eucyclogobius newberryi TaxID=166745 RepID=UPI003B59E0C2
LSDWSAGSVDSDSYVSVSGRRRWGRSLMSMRKTLALLYVALVWSRQKITLCDLLRLVERGVVPYVNSYECFHDDMKLSSRDGLIFRVQSIPSYSMIHSESKNLIKFLQLPAFPPISSQSPLHPLNLSLRLLMELNLPDEMSQCVESVLSRADLVTSARLTLDPKSYQLPHYELLAAAAIIVSMKLLFGLDDETEWELSSEASSTESGEVFSLRRWYRLLQGALHRGQRRRRQHKARKQWVPKKPFYFTQKEKIVTLKRRRVSEQLTSCFQRLSPAGGSAPHSLAQGGGAFHFLWGRGPDADGRSMHHMTLKGGTRNTQGFLLSEENYWHAPFISCRGRGHLLRLRDDLPQMFVWILELFSFVLDLKPDVLFEAVSRLEKTLLKVQRPKRTKRPKRTARRPPKPGPGPRRSRKP